MLQTTVTTLAPREAGTLFEQRTRGAEAKATFMLPLWVWVITAGLAIWGSFSANPVLTPVSLIILTVAIQLLWRRGEPPVLPFACAMQWLQAAAVIFYTDFYKVSVEQAGGGPELETATWLSLVAVLILSLGIRLAFFRCRYSQHARLTAEVFRVNIVNAFIFYVASFG